MNYADFPGSRPQARPGGPNLGLLLIMGLIALFLYSRYQNTASSPFPQIPQDAPEIGGRATPRPVGGIGRPAGTRPASSSQANSGDWSIEEVETKGRSTPGGQLYEAAEGPHRTARGDWELEVGESQPPPKSAPTKTQRGDWTIEEVNPN